MRCIMCFSRLTTYQRQIYQGNLKILATQVKTSLHSLQNCVQFKRYQTTDQNEPTCDPMMCRYFHTTTKFIEQAYRVYIINPRTYDPLLCRYFHTTTKFIDQAVSSGGLIVVNCVMGWSRCQA